MLSNVTVVKDLESEDETQVKAEEGNRKSLSSSLASSASSFINSKKAREQENTKYVMLVCQKPDLDSTPGHFSIFDRSR